MVSVYLKKPFFSPLNVVVCNYVVGNVKFLSTALLARRSVLGERGSGWEADPVDS